jgi:hypothetical protein
VGKTISTSSPLTYWRALFRERGYAAFDFLRPLIFDDPAIARWYRFNTILYLRDDIMVALPDAVRWSRVPDAQALDDYWPLQYRLRNAVIKRLPTRIVDRISQLNAVWAARVAAA